jgi:thiol-disulfide isomerase/thioredoxin
MQRWRKLFLVPAILLAPLTVRAADVLNVGDAAPEFKVAETVKGDKIEKLDPKKTYVVEFWATWCGPCRTTIPHLTELSHKYKDKGVTFIGVDAFERDLTLVRPFLEEMGSKMDYTVVLDSVPEGKKPQDGAMAKGWMAAAEENGIPTAFVVKNGKVAWIGHPMTMDKALEEIVADKWDSAAFAKERLTTKLAAKKMNDISRKVTPLLRAKDYKEVIKALDEATSGDAELTKRFTSMRFLALCMGADVDAGLALGNQLLKDNNDSAGALVQSFAPLVSPQNGDADPRVLAMATQGLKRAVELTKEKDFQSLDALATALSKGGDFKAAATAQDKALEAVKPLVKSEDHPILKAFKNKADSYRKSAEDKAAK